MSQIQLPSSFNQSITICRFEILKSLKEKRFAGLLAITLGISIFLVLAPEIFGTDIPRSATEYLLTPLGFLFFLLVIVSALFGSSSIVSEFHERTCYSLFVNPITRNTIWFGKFLAAETLAIAIIGIFYGIISVGAFAEYEELPKEIFQSIGFSILTVTMLMSFSFLISSISRGPTSAAVIVFFLFILFLPLMDQILMGIGEIKPWFSPTFSKGIIENSLLDPYPIDITPGELPRGPFDIQRFVPYVDESIMIMISYSVVFSLASLFFFKRREMLQ